MTPVWLVGVVAVPQTGTKNIFTNVRNYSKRRLQLAKLFKESLQELPLDLFKEIFPPFKKVDQVMEFIEFLPQLGGIQTCCTSTKEPCGNPTCEIRTCVRNKGYRTCAECIEYKTCLKLDFLKPHHTTLLSDLDFIKKNGFDQYVEQIIAKYKVKPMVIGCVNIASGNN